MPSYIRNPAVNIELIVLFGHHRSRTTQRHNAFGGEI